MKKIKRLGVEKYSESFGSEAKSFGTNSGWWLLFAIISFTSIVTFGLIILSNGFENYAKEISDKIVNETSQKEKLENSIIIFYVVQQAITKLVIVSALFYALSVCVKNYRANKHNQTINKHRRTAINTFQAFSESTKDEQTKNAILLEATRTIFGHQSSGFTSSEKDSDMPSKVIEIFKPVKTGD